MELEEHGRLICENHKSEHSVLHIAASEEEDGVEMKQGVFVVIRKARNFAPECRTDGKHSNY